MKTTFKLLKWLFGLAIGIPVLGYLVWLTGNLSDEELHPEVAQLLARKQGNPDTQNNVYFDYIGLNAPEGQDPKQWGITWFNQASAIDAGYEKTINQQLASPTSWETLKEVRPEIEKTVRTSTVEAKDIPCNSIEKCIENVAADPSKAKGILDGEAIILKRYDAILDGRFNEPYRDLLRVQSPLTPTLHKAYQLSATRFALEVSEGKHAEAITRWGRETQFYERMLEGAQTLIGKLVAANFLHRQHALLAQYLSLHPQHAQAKRDFLAEQLKPLHPGALSLQEPINIEIAQVARIALDLEAGRNAGYLLSFNNSWPARIRDLFFAPFYSPRATANLIATPFLEWREISSLTGEQYRQAVTALGKKLNAASADLTGMVFRYQNPIGSIISQSGSPTNFSSYLFKRDNIAAERALLAFALEMALHDQPEVVSEMTRRNNLGHPFTGQLPVWDEKTRSLSFPLPETFKDMKNATPIVIHLPNGKST